MDTLESRRLISDLVMYYKIIHFSADSDDFFQLKSDQRTRGHMFTIIKQKFRTNVERYAFKNRRIDVWNKLPIHVVNAPNVLKFKKELNNLPRKFYDKYLFIK